MTSLTGKQDRVKLAIQSQPLLGTKQPLLLEVANNSELVTVIRDICSQWSVSNPEQYALKYAEPAAAGHATAKFGYITESNRQHLKNGDILTVAKLPALAARDIYNKICNTGEERKAAMTELVGLSRDYVFALEFIYLTGVQQLMTIVEQSQLGNAADVDLLMYLSEAFQELMQHNVVSWEALTENFVKKLINFIEKSNDIQYFQASIVSMCLDILQSTISNSPKFYELISKDVSIEHVMPFLDKPENEVKRTTLAFINAMISKAPKKEDVFKKLFQFGRQLKDSVLSRFQSESTVPREIAQELYVYQCHLLNQYESRMKQKFVAGDAYMEEDLLHLPARAFQDEYGNKSRIVVSEAHWKQLGFLKWSDPRQEFMETPPGVLALDCMVYFAKHKHDLYSRFVLVHAENQCPFADASVALTKVLCNIFRVGEPPIELAHEFIPLIVTNDEPFKDIFGVTIQLLFKTWREMRASVLDLEKVMVVVTKQILTLLQSSATLTTLDILKQKLFELTYKKIIEAEENSQLLDESVLKSKPVQELSEAIRPEIIELVKQERLRHLVEGATFPKIGRRGRDQLFCCRLSPNYKMLHFGDITGEQVPPLEALDKKIPVSEMKLEVGAACPHADKVRRGGGNQSLFSIFYEENEHLDFIAPNETVFNIWVDGLSVLLNRKMTSKAAEEDIETLLNMDLKLRLLDIENVTIPNQIPTIPKEPLDYDFFYKLD
ncbi:hypothetical protein EMCRGX_G000215 [Ephydatia muelleri]